MVDFYVCQSGEEGSVEVESRDQDRTGSRSEGKIKVEERENERDAYQTRHSHDIDAPFCMSVPR